MLNYITIEYFHTFHVVSSCIAYLGMQVPRYTYFDLSIADSNVLTEWKWCAACDLAGYNIFSNDL